MGIACIRHLHASNDLWPGTLGTKKFLTMAAACTQHGGPKTVASHVGAGAAMASEESLGLRPVHERLGVSRLDIFTRTVPAVGPAPSTVIS